MASNAAEIVIPSYASLVNGATFNATVSGGSGLTGTPRFAYVTSSTLAAASPTGENLKQPKRVAPAAAAFRPSIWIRRLITRTWTNSVLLWGQADWSFLMIRPECLIFPAFLWISALTKAAGDVCLVV